MNKCQVALCLLILVQGLITAVLSAQLTVLTLPEALVSSSGNVVEGSVIQIYCTVEGDTTVTFSWTFNGTTLLNDPPHIRMREDNRPERSASLLTDDSTSVLTVDNFRVSDNGMYQCIATNGSNTSGNGAAVKLTAVTSTADGTLDVILQPSNMEPVDQSAFFNDNRTGVALGGTIDGSVMTCTAGHQGDGLMNYSLPSVVWVRNGQVVDDIDSRITITSTTMANGRLTSSLTITKFAAGDAGVYQCVFTDDSDGVDTELITSIPYQLDTGNTIHIERVSPEVILLRPPEKLVIEVKVSGDYEVLYWTKDGNKLSPLNVAPQEYPNFHEIFVRGSTTSADKGIYTVQPQFKPGTQQTHLLSPIGGVTFGVSPPVDASTTALSGPVVVIPEGGSEDIRCRSTGTPVPSITWQLNNQTSEFEQTDVVNQFDAPLTNTDTGTIAQLTPGNIESTLRIVSARYPDHDGVYTCVGTNTDELNVASSSASIKVQINVVPEVEITATRTLVGVGEDVTLSCVILRGNPANYDTTITHINTGNSFPGPTLILTGFHATDNGTYSCEVTNDAGTGSADVTIELGDPPVVTTLQPGPVIVSRTVELVCVVTGDTPIDIVWERLHTNGSVQVVYAGNDTTGGNFSLTATLDSFGMYRCNATSRFRMDSSSINITQAVGPTLPADENVEIVVGTLLNLTVTITGFNLPLTEITWSIDSVPAIPSPGGLTITDSSTDSPPALSTLTIDPVQFPSQGGLYSVRAINPAGNDITTFNVIVTAPPDTPVNVTVISFGARWIFLHWMLTFNGNKPVIFHLYRNSDNHTLINELPAGVQRTTGGEFVYNISDRGLISPQTNHSFVIVACNSIGCSNQSLPSIAVTTLKEAALLIQLRIVGIDGCQQWVLDNGRQQLNNVSEALSMNVEERCQCGFSSLNILEPNFHCFAQSEEAVTYRAKVSGTVTSSADEIVGYIRQWLAEGALIAFELISIPIDSSCQVAISSILDPECNAPLPMGDFPVAVIGGAVGAIGLLFIALIVVLCILTRCKKAKRHCTVNKTGRSEIELSSVNTYSVSGEYETPPPVDKLARSSSPVYEEIPAATMECNYYDYIVMRTVTSGHMHRASQGFDYTDCAAYNVVGT